QETAAHQETMPAEADVEELEETFEEEEIDEDDLTLPDADTLFGRRRDVVPTPYNEDIEDGEEFDIDLDAPEPSTPPIEAPAIAAAPPPVLEAPQPIEEVAPPIELPAPPAAVVDAPPAVA